MARSRATCFDAAALTAIVFVLVVVNLIFAARGLVSARRSFDRVVGREFGADVDLPQLSIVVPARNEERQIESCVRSLLCQHHPAFEVVVVDDCSEDATRSILERLASQDSRLKVVAGKPLPAGWVGKPWALVQGVAVARGEWLLFTDADTFHLPHGAASVHATAIQHGLDVLSVLTEQDLETLAERALMPSLFLAILWGTGPIADVGDPGKSDVALFNGQYIVISRDAYDAIGGHAAVRGEIAEDLELARAFKRDGRFRIALMASQDVARTRMYRSLSEIWHGFTKNFALGVRGRPRDAAVGIVGLTCLSPLSPVALVWLAATAQWPLAAALALGMAASLALVAYQLRLMRLSPALSVWFPIGIAYTAVVLVSSMLLFASGRGVCWRGRRYTGNA